MTQPVKIIMVEDDHGHAKLIEKNIRRANISNEIKHFDEGGGALDYLFSAEILANGPLLILLVLGLPAADDMDPARLAGFQLILGQSPRLMVAGIIAYGVSQFLNVTIFSRLRGARGGRLLAFRGAVASALSQVIDTLLFISIAFIGVFPIWQLLVGQMLAKVVLSLVVVPFLIVGAVKLGRRLDGTTGA